MKGKRDISCHLKSILESLVIDELIPHAIQDLSNGMWQDLMLSPENVRINQDEFLELAKQFQTKLNEVILPVRLGIFTLYSVKKLSIFNRNVLKILDFYI